MPGLRVTEDASAGAWLAPRLHGHFGAVTLSVPSGYAAYARICHPVTDRDGRSASWSQVAAATGRRAHALMQWHAVVGSPDSLNFTGSLWPGGDPERGNLAPVELALLCEQLATHTELAECCFFGLWIGWGWVEQGSVRLSAGSASRAGVGRVATTGSGEPEPTFSAEELQRPRLKLPGREYLMLSGPLSAATQLGDAAGFWPQSPNLIWPPDRTWCVASEIDFDSTLVGGTPELIQAILDAPGLDSWRVGPDDSLAYDADRINLV